MDSVSQNSNCNCLSMVCSSSYSFAGGFGGEQQLRALGSLQDTIIAQVFMYTVSLNSSCNCLSMDCSSSYALRAALVGNSSKAVASGFAACAARMGSWYARLLPLAVPVVSSTS